MLRGSRLIRSDRTVRSGSENHVSEHSIRQPIIKHISNIHIIKIQNTKTRDFFFFNNYLVGSIVLYYSCSMFLFLKVQATIFWICIFNVEIYLFILIITKYDLLVLYIRIVIGVEVYWEKNTINWVCLNDHTNTNASNLIKTSPLNVFGWK